MGTNLIRSQAFIFCSFDSNAVLDREIVLSLQAHERTKPEGIYSFTALFLE